MSHGKKNGASGPQGRASPPLEGETPLDVAQLLEGRRILVTGATGFVGKVALSMLLHRYPGIGRVFVLVRPGTGGSAVDRFFGKVAPAAPSTRSAPSTAAPSSPSFARRWSRSPATCRTPSSASRSGTSRSSRGSISVLNSAGLVDFDPSLELALGVNVRGAQNGAELCQRLSSGLVHVSTCFVAGNRDGVVFEDEPIPGYFPRREGVVPGKGKAPDLEPVDFNYQTELGDAERRIAEVRAQADDRVLQSGFRERARERLKEAGRAPRRRQGHAARHRAREAAVALGAAGGAGHGAGPPLGLAQHLHLHEVPGRAGHPRERRAPRPGPAFDRGERPPLPVPGLERGVHHQRPARLHGAPRPPDLPHGRAGHPRRRAGGPGGRRHPRRRRRAPGAAPAPRPGGQGGRTVSRVYHLASGDVNPFWAPRAVELTALYRRRFFLAREEGNRTWNRILSRIEPVSTSKTRYQAFSTPAFLALVKGARKLIDEQAPSWGTPRLSALLHGVSDELDEWTRRLEQTQALWDLYLPFVWNNRYVFRCAAIRALRERLLPEDRARLPWDPEALDWRQYWMEVHMKGMEEWVFPGFDEEARKKVHAVRAHRDLLELLDSSAAAFPGRTALRMAGAEKERLTYAELKKLSEKVASFLLDAGRRSRRPGAARLREPAGVGGGLLRHPARRSGRRAGRRPALRRRDPEPLEDRRCPHHPALRPGGRAAPRAGGSSRLPPPRGPTLCSSARRSMAGRRNPRPARRPTISRRSSSRAAPPATPRA